MTTTLTAEEQCTDAELVAAARSGNVAAFESLVGRHFQSAYAIAWMRLREREAAEELAQEVMLRAWLNIARLRDGAAFGGWIARMAHHLAIDWQRRRTRASRLARMVPMEAEMDNMIDGTAPHGRDTAQARQERELLDRALAEMPRDDRQIVVLHFGQEMSHREIAQRLNVHHTTVGRRIEKALAELKRVVERQAATAGALHPMQAAPGARMHACALVAAAALLAPEAKAALAATASATAPAAMVAAEAIAATASGAAGATASASGTGSGIGALLKACAAHKVLVTSIVAVVGAGAVGLAVLHGGAPHQLAAHAVEAFVQGPPTADTVLQYAAGDELLFSQSLQGAVRVDFAESADLEIESILFRGGEGGALLASIKRTDGFVDEAVVTPRPSAAAADGKSIFMRYINNGKTQAAEMLTFTVDANANGGVDVSLFANSSKDFLDDSEAIFASYFEGRASQKDAAAKWLDDAGKAGLLPPDDAHRARVRNAQHKWTK